MARHPQPESLAKLKGADKKNPQRYRKQSPKSALPLGKMPDHMSAEAKVVWFELEAYALQGVLTGADRMVMELTAELVAEFRLAPREMPASRIGHMIGCLARLGLTPADRQKLGTDPAPEGNPFNEF